MTPCDVCRKQEVKIVCSSKFAAMSIGYCPECHAAGREPWFVLIGTLFAVPRGSLSESAAKMLQPTLDFYGRSLDEAYAEAERLDHYYFESYEVKSHK